MTFRRLALFALVLATLAPAAFVRADTPVPTTIKDHRFTMDDGILIDSDIYLPDAPENGPYPCLVEHTPYRKELRASEGAGFLATPAQGFVLIEIDARGNGGSNGEYDIVFSKREQLDAASVVAQAPYLQVNGHSICKNKVGMFGGSYSGIIQYLVASIPSTWSYDRNTPWGGTDGLSGPPPDLAAIAPQRAYGDLYRDIVYHGGIVIGSFGTVWSAGTTGYYTAPPLDLNTPQGQAAWTDHLTKNDPMIPHYIEAPYEDARYDSNASTPPYSQDLYKDSSILPRIGNLRVPTLHLAGEFDAFTRGQLLTIEKALQQEYADPSGHGPNYAVIGPWNHSNTHFITPANPGPPVDGSNPSVLSALLAEWYHHWLDAGPVPSFMAAGKPRVWYYRLGNGALLDTTGSWQQTNAWPPAATYERRYLRAGNLLSVDAPTGAEAGDSYVANPTAGTAELLSRYDNAASGSIPMPAWDQRTDEPKGLSYSTAAFGSPVRVTGPINLHLTAETIGLRKIDPVSDSGLLQQLPPYHDTDFIVKISDVAPDGTALLITEGYLRASHRTLDTNNSEFDSVSGDVIRAQHYDDSGHIAPPPQGQPVSYDIEIWPMAKVFAADHRIRLDIYSADTPTHLTLLKPALNTVLHGLGQESYLTIPIAPEN
ncbi:MAG: CocE/NonD family hydrolase [Actinomycetota bacterium]|nr:CocE/NonD family hydrolase [Actinomycetota bacterium]